MSVFYEDARNIFAAANASTENADFALLLMPNGSVRMVMGRPVSLEGAATDAGAATAYHVVRDQHGVRVSGMSGSRRCVLEEARGNCKGPGGMLRDRPLYALESAATLSLPA